MAHLAQPHGSGEKETALPKHSGIPGVNGQEFVKVKLPPGIADGFLFGSDVIIRDSARPSL